MNGILKYILTKDITDMNNLLLAAGRVVQRKVGTKRNENGKAKEPLWKRRLRSKMSDIRKDLGRVECWKRGELANVDLKYELERKYLVKKKGIDVVIEELKQRMKTIQYRIKRYKDRTEQYKQNRIFETNQKRLYEIIDSVHRINEEAPNAGDCLEFWSGIWSKPANHNANAEWLTKLEKKLKNVEKQDNILIDFWKSSDTAQ